MRTWKLVYGWSQLLVRSCLFMLWFRNICTSNQKLSLHLGSRVLCKCEESKFGIQRLEDTEFSRNSASPFSQGDFNFQTWGVYFPSLMNTSVQWLVYFVRAYIRTIRTSWLFPCSQEHWSLPLHPNGLPNMLGEYQQPGLLVLCSPYSPTKDVGLLCSKHRPFPFK